MSYYYIPKIESLKKLVETSYKKIAQQQKFWPNKYNINRQITKYLTDYTLLSKTSPFGKKILNIGCSEPIDELYWVEIVKEWHVLDINKEIVENATKLASLALPQKQFSKLKFITGDVLQLEIDDDSYDVVISFSTIDHIPGKENREKAIKEMVRVLKKGGYLVITVPNRWDLIYYIRLNIAMRKGETPFGYAHAFSPLELKHLLNQNNLKIIDCASTAFNPYSYTDRLLFRLRLANLKKYFGMRFGYLAQK